MSTPEGLLARTVEHLEHRDPDLVLRLRGRDPSAPLTLVEVRAIVVRLRSQMLDATFDDTHIGPDISATSELYEAWRQVLEGMEV
jgi:hypothetical protein